ncbi:MAG: membrane protein insertase YidC [Lentisphaeria bacterium]
MDRTSVIAVVVCALLLFFTWPKGSSPVESQNNVAAITEQIAPAATSVVESKVDTTPVFKNITIQSQELIAEFDPNIGGFSNFVLNNYKEKVGDESPYKMVADADKFFAIKNANGLKLTTVSADKQGETIILTQKIDGYELVITRTFKFNEQNPNLIETQFTIVNPSTTPVILGDFLFNAGVSRPLEPGKTSYMYGGNQNQRVSWIEDGSVKSEKLEDIVKMDAHKRHERVFAKWMAVENRYFCSVVTASEPFSGVVFANSNESVDKSIALTGYGVLPTSTIAAGQNITLNFSAYVGAKKYSSLQQLGNGQEDILDLGWSFIRPISKIVLKVLVWFHSIGLSYGLAVILITIIIKALFWPITHKSTVSMKKVAEIQPKVKEIREKHKDNQQLQQQKIMELYRTEKVNPLGGCLPMLIQIPVFFALYSTFRSAVELRHVNFLWCVDLAKPDTIAEIFSLAINPLALIMVVSMLAQQMLTPATGDANQKKIMMVMPLVMLIFMYDMPAGLTLYWTVNQLISIVQQFVTNKSINKNKKMA